MSIKGESMGESIDIALTDEALWNSFRGGDEQTHERAFERIYATSFRDLYVYGYRIAGSKELAEDCIHDLFVYLYDHRTTLGTTTSIKFYLFRSLRRLIVTALKQRHNLVSPDELPANFEFDVALPHEAIIVESDAEREAQRALQQMLEALPKRQKEALYLAYYEGFSNSHIAEVMGVEVETVYNLVYRAMTTLKANSRGLLGSAMFLLAARILLRSGLTL
jgi:RNA polymerase sigma factor (sigma-70 family)